MSDYCRLEKFLFQSIFDSTTKSALLRPTNVSHHRRLHIGIKRAVLPSSPSLIGPVLSLRRYEFLRVPEVMPVFSLDADFPNFSGTSRFVVNVSLWLRLTVSSLTSAQLFHRLLPVLVPFYTCRTTVDLRNYLYLLPPRNRRFRGLLTSLVIDVCT